MDIYSLHSSADAVLQYLREHDPEAARRAEARYHCLDRWAAGLLPLKGLRASFEGL